MKDKNEEISQIPIDSISDPESPIRTRADENAIYDLADSIRDVGLINPLIVRHHGNGYEVIAGHRRLIACRIVGMLTVASIVRPFDDTGCDVVRLHENLGREDVNIVDQARFFEKIMTKLELSVPELAAKIKRSETFIRDRLALLKWPKDVFEAVNNQKLSFSAAKHLAQIKDDNVRRSYLSAAIRSGISPRIAYDWLMSWRSRKLPEPPPLEGKPCPAGKEEVRYYTSRCRLCGEQIEVGTEEVIYTHKKCIEELERVANPPA